MSYFYRSEQTLKILLTMCVFGVLPLKTDQFPAAQGFAFLLYPVSVVGPYQQHTLLIPVTTADHNTQLTHTAPADHSKMSHQRMFEPLKANSAFLKSVTRSAPVPAHGSAHGSAPSPAPDLHALPSESPALQAQMSNFLPSNVPQQVYSFIQQAVISDSDSSEEGDVAQVIYMLPVSVESPNMGVMEGTSTDPVPGHLQVPTSTSATLTSAHPDAQGQFRGTTGAARRAQRGILEEKSL
ncbi:uncharacterized protein si:ch211-149b19.4 [Myxocyprinus asiaticus]|uniref:uncharacterized protein si:ch211-149b19.4 n=1 Tax=Myxocyprinus asiaticus TaxID=70543 RepID=UPI002221EA13|nr:uncharacterized protein si:ch211-149b19.4 [Myxocyprinus asiaticus]